MFGLQKGCHGLPLKLSGRKFASPVQSNSRKQVRKLISIRKNSSFLQYPAGTDSWKNNRNQQSKSRSMKCSATRKNIWSNSMAIELIVLTYINAILCAWQFVTKTIVADHSKNIFILLSHQLLWKANRKYLKFTSRFNQHQQFICFSEAQKLKNVKKKIEKSHMILKILKNTLPRVKVLTTRFYRKISLTDSIWCPWFFKRFKT